MFAIENGIKPNRDLLDSAPWHMMCEGQSFYVSKKESSHAKVTRACSKWSASLRKTFIAEKEGDGSRVFMTSNVVKKENNVEVWIKDVVSRNENGETAGIIVNKLRRFDKDIVLKALKNLEKDGVLNVNISIHPRKKFKFYRYTLA